MSDSELAAPDGYRDLPEIDVAQIATTPIGQLINRLVWAAPAKGNQRWMAGTIKEVGLSSATIKVADWTCHRFWHQLRWRDNNKGDSQSPEN